MNVISNLSDTLNALPEHIPMPFVSRPPRPYSKIPGDVADDNYIYPSTTTRITHEG